MAAPEIVKLIPFPPTLKLFQRNLIFESDSTTSGAQVLSLRSGRVVMRFEVPVEWTFSNGQQAQETSTAVTANQPADISMPYRLKTSLRDVLQVRIRVVVRMEDETSEEAAPRVQPVSYATRLDKFLHFFRFGRGDE